jgi:hypothetical protein
MSDPVSLEPPPRQAPVIQRGRSRIGHETVNHGRGEYARGDAHTDTVEGYFALLKRGRVWAQTRGRPSMGHFPGDPGRPA